MTRIVVDEIPETLSLNSYELVLTPTKAIARSIKVSHRTLEGAAETIVKKQGMRIASGLLTRRLLQNAVSEFLKVRDVAGITNLWMPVIQELLSSGNDLILLQEHPINRVSKLAKIALFYQQQLRIINCIDRSELFLQATNYCQRKRSCFFYGYFSPNQDSLAFINALAKNNSLLVLPYKERNIFNDNRIAINYLKNQKWQIKDINIKAKQQHLGKRLQQSYLDRKVILSEVKLHDYPNLEAEARGVLTQVKVLLDKGINPQDIVITTKDEQLYGSTLFDIAWEYDIPLRAFYDVSFLTTRIGYWLQLLLEIITEINNTDNLPFESIIKLLSHPLVKKIDANTWQSARLSHPQTMENWQSIGVDLSLLKLPQKLEASQWIEVLKQILDTFKISHKVKLWAKEIVAYYKFQEALQELFLTNNDTITRETLISELQELLNSLTIPIQPGRGGVELHSPLSLFGSNYQYVFVLGMAETIFPASLTDDLVLNFCDRKILSREQINVNTAAKIMQKEALAFYFLLGVPTQQIIFSYPQILARQATYPSPYLTQLKLQAISKKQSYLASIEEASKIYLRNFKAETTVIQNRDLSIEQLIYFESKWQIENDREQGIHNEYSGAIEIPLDYKNFTFSASQLTQIGQCAFKWFASRLLKIKEIPETKLVLEANTRGSLYHQCLELCLAEVSTVADLEKFNLQQLNRAFQVAEQNLQIPDIPSWENQKNELLKTLKINLTAPAFLPTGSEIIDRERQFTTQWHGLKIKGTIDRLDKTPTGLKVIDYKSSSSTPSGIKDESGKATVDIQIPLYIDVVTQEYPAETVDATYYSLSTCKPMRRNQSNPEELAEFAERVKQHLAAGDYPIAPDIQFKACEYCQFDLICRK